MPGAEVVGVVALVARAGRAVEDAGAVEVVEVARARPACGTRGCPRRAASAPSGGPRSGRRSAGTCRACRSRTGGRRAAITADRSIFISRSEVCSMWQASLRAESGAEARQVRVAGDVAGRRDHRVAAAGLPVERARVGGARADLAQPAAVRPQREERAPARCGPSRTRSSARRATRRGRRRRRAASSAAAPGRRRRASPTARAAAARARRRFLPLRGFGAAAGQAREGDPAPVGRPRGVAVVGDAAGQGPRAAPGRLDVDVAVAHERDRAGGAPGGRLVVGGARGQLPGAVAVGVDGRRGRGRPCSRGRTRARRRPATTSGRGSARARR